MLSIMSFQVSFSEHWKLSARSYGRAENWDWVCSGGLKPAFSSNSWWSSETEGGMYCGWEGGGVADRFDRELGGRSLPRESFSRL